MHWLEVGVTVAGVAVSVGTAAWAVLRKLTRILDAFENFPPHRHVNGKILFPKGFEPTAIESRQI